MSQAKKTKIKALSVRLPNKLYVQLKRDAKVNGRSINSQLIMLLGEMLAD